MANDLERLVEFLDRLDEVILFALDRRTQLLTPPMVPFFELLIPSYRNRMGTLRSEVSNASPAQLAQLVRNGLTGTELDTKLAGFNTAYGGFIATKQTDVIDETDGWPRWRRWIKKAFGWGNVILKSFPFGAKDPVEEIKGTIERGIDDAGDHEFSDGNIIFKRP